MYFCNCYHIRTTHVIVSKDFNVDLLGIQAKYVNLFTDFHFAQHIITHDQPTLVTSFLATLIDHVLTLPPLNVAKCCQANDRS